MQVAAFVLLGSKRKFDNLFATDFETATPLITNYPPPRVKTHRFRNAHIVAADLFQTIVKCVL